MAKDHLIFLPLLANKIKKKSGLIRKQNIT